MKGQSGGAESGVRVFRPDQLDVSLALAFGVQRFAEMTHLPTGAASGRVKTIDVPPGGELTELVERGCAILLHVILGEFRVGWGRSAEHSTTARAGDSVFVPAGVALRVVNSSPVEALQFILLRGD